MTEFMPPPNVMHHMGIECGPWSMESSELNAVLMRGWGVFDRLTNGDITAAKIKRMGRIDPRIRRGVYHGVGHVQIQGVLVRNESLLSRSLRANSYATLRQDLQELVDDDEAKAILLEIRYTGGGELHGCGELADAIFAARDSKPVHAFVEFEALGAGCLLASAAEHVTVSAEANIGKLGVTKALPDSADRGVYVSSGKTLPSKAPRQEADWQKIVDGLADVLIGSVAEYRHLSFDNVAKSIGHLGVLKGKAAVDAGIADEVGTLETALARLRPQ